MVNLGGGGGESLCSSRTTTATTAATTPAVTIVPAVARATTAQPGNAMLKPPDAVGVEVGARRGGWPESRVARARFGGPLSAPCFINNDNARRVTTHRHLKKL